MLEFYERYRPEDKTVALLHKIIDIIKEYQAAGLTMTLRQLFYQLVSRDEIQNTKNEYKRLGEIVSKARRGGILDWLAVEDRIRIPFMPPEFSGLTNLIDSAVESYRLPRLHGQDRYVELWVEKDALAGVLAPIANEYHVPLMVNRGYSSTSAMKEAGERVRSQVNAIGCDDVTILYLGDFDPSGEDMVRDIQVRLDEYVNSGTIFKLNEKTKKWEAEASHARAIRLRRTSVEVEKLALTMEQIQQYKPPPNVAKPTDSRYAAFVKKHGHSSWEVDALPPTVLRDLIVERLDDLIDAKLVAKIKKQEELDKKRLAKAMKSIQKKPRKARRKKS